MIRRLLAAALILAALILAALPAAAEEHWEGVATRPDVTQRFFFRPVERPIGSVVLFVGGEGAYRETTLNFLNRVRSAFADAGYQVALPAAPSDHEGGLLTFRGSAAHAEDIAAVIAFLRAKAAVPVWLIGTSRGTISAANVAARLPKGAIDGLILTSSVTLPSKRISQTVNDVALENIHMPVLVLHNRADTCGVTPVGGAQQLAKDLSADFITVDGGSTDSDPCESLSPHGYYGIEDQATKIMLDWLAAHRP